MNNRILTKRYPFLLPRNVFTDELPEDYDYSWTLLDTIENGWKTLFLMMCEEIRIALVEANYLDEFRFSQVKEKWGKLCIYHFGAPKEVIDIIRRYEKTSARICVNCGRIATKTTVGYILPYCDYCAEQVAKHEDLVDIEVGGDDGG
jgi:hypothetical protein